MCVSKTVGLDHIPISYILSDISEVSEFTDVANQAVNLKINIAIKEHKTNISFNCASIVIARYAFCGIVSVIDNVKCLEANYLYYYGCRFKNQFLVTQNDTSKGIFDPTSNCKKAHVFYTRYCLGGALSKEFYQKCSDAIKTILEPVGNSTICLYKHVIMPNNKNKVQLLALGTKDGMLYFLCNTVSQRKCLVSATNDVLPPDHNVASLEDCFDGPQYAYTKSYIANVPLKDVTDKIVVPLNNSYPNFIGKIIKKCLIQEWEVVNTFKGIFTLAGLPVAVWPKTEWKIEYIDSTRFSTTTASVITIHINFIQSISDIHVLNLGLYKIAIQPDVCYGPFYNYPVIIPDSTLVVPDLVEGGYYKIACWVLASAIAKYKVSSENAEYFSLTDVGVDFLRFGQEYDPKTIALCDQFQTSGSPCSWDSTTEIFTCSNRLDYVPFMRFDQLLYGASKDGIILPVLRKKYDHDPVLPAGPVSSNWASYLRRDKNNYELFNEEKAVAACKKFFPPFGVNLNSGIMAEIIACDNSFISDSACITVRVKGEGCITKITGFNDILGSLDHTIILSITSTIVISLNVYCNKQPLVSKQIQFKKKTRFFLDKETSGYVCGFDYKTNIVDHVPGLGFKVVPKTSIYCLPIVVSTEGAIRRMFDEDVNIYLKFYAWRIFDKVSYKLECDLDKCGDLPALIGQYKICMQGYCTAWVEVNSGECGKWNFYKCANYYAPYIIVKDSIIWIGLSVFFVFFCIYLGLAYRFYWRRGWIFKIIFMPGYLTTIGICKVLCFLKYIFRKTFGCCLYHVCARICCFTCLDRCLDCFSTIYLVKFFRQLFSEKQKFEEKVSRATGANDSKRALIVIFIFVFFVKTATGVKVAVDNSNTDKPVISVPFIMRGERGHCEKIDFQLTSGLTKSSVICIEDVVYNFNAQMLFNAYDAGTGSTYWTNCQPSKSHECSSLSTFGLHQFCHASFKETRNLQIITQYCVASNWYWTYYFVWPYQVGADTLSKYSVSFFNYKIKFSINGVLKELTIGESHTFDDLELRLISFDPGFKPELSSLVVYKDKIWKELGNFQVNTYGSPYYFTSPASFEDPKATWPGNEALDNLVSDLKVKTNAPMASWFERDLFQPYDAHLPTGCYFDNPVAGLTVISIRGCIGGSINLLLTGFLSLKATEILSDVSVLKVESVDKCSLINPLVRVIVSIIGTQGVVVVNSSGLCAPEYFNVHNTIPKYYMSCVVRNDKYTKKVIFTTKSKKYELDVTVNCEARKGMVKETWTVTYYGIPEGGGLSITGDFLSGLFGTWRGIISLIMLVVTFFLIGIVVIGGLWVFSKTCSICVYGGKCIMCLSRCFYNTTFQPLINQETHSLENVTLGGPPVDPKSKVAP